MDTWFQKSRDATRAERLGSSKDHFVAGVKGLETGLVVGLTSLSIDPVHGVIVPIIYCLVFFSFKNVQLDCSLMPTSLNHL